MSGGTTVLTLDPYRCIPKKNQKYASECTEVYLANKGATSISEHFRRFPNIEVIWLNGNRLPRLENLDSNFRIREVYVQGNTLVSLTGLRNLKFLRVLLASDNQLRNLDKQLNLLARFAFLNKLDLYGNPVAEEPDYRLRLMYNIPQVEILDQHSVKVLERIKADEVVPNLDKVSAAKAEKQPRKTQELSCLEQDCFSAARKIQQRKEREDQDMFDRTFSTNTATHWQANQTAPVPRVFQENKEHWASSQHLVRAELNHPTPWERNDRHHFGDLGSLGKGKGSAGGEKEDGMRSYIKRVAGKEEMNKADVTRLTMLLSSSDEGGFGRVLGVKQVFELPPITGGTARTRRSQVTAGTAEVQPLAAGGPLAKLIDDPDSTISVTEVADWLLTLEWPRPDDDILDRRIDKLYEDAKRGELSGDQKVVSSCQNQALRLEGAKSKKAEVDLGVSENARAFHRSRADVFKQTFLRPVREVDDSTGRLMVKVSPATQTTRLTV